MIHEIRIAANAQSVDLSTKKSRRLWRDYLVSAGIRNCAIAAPGQPTIYGEAAERKIMALLSD